jgi:hypothetical protein
VKERRAAGNADGTPFVTPEQAKTALVGYKGCFGTCEVDQRAGVVIHHVEGGLIPNREGGDQRRRFTLSSDMLVLERPVFQTAGRQRTRRTPAGGSPLTSCSSSSLPKVLGTPPSS